MIVYGARPFFRDRIDAGQQLAEKLDEYRGQTVVLAIPRGGVPVAVPVAEKLGARLDLVIPRKVAMPHNPEAGYGAVAEDGAVVLNEPLVQQLQLTDAQIKNHADRVREEIRRRSAVYRGRLPAADITGQTTIIVDDGLASGYTMLAAVKSVLERKAARTVVAVPVASANAFDLIRPAVDDLVCLVVAHTFPFAVASFYQNWYDLSDEEVLAYLEEWARRVNKSKVRTGGQS